MRLQATGAGTIGLSGAAYGPALRSLGRAWRPRVAAGVRTVTVAVDLAPSDHTHPLPGLAAAGAWRDERIAALVDAVHARFGCAALDYGGVRRSRWMGRKIAFDRIPDPAA